MARVKFGGFVAPHHPIGEHPTLQLQRDLELAEHLDKLGFDEFWCGEHHSTGWEVIASPELFLAAAGERTHRIMLGTGVISLSYHHPFNVAQLWRLYRFGICLQVCRQNILRGEFGGHF